MANKTTNGIAQVLLTGLLAYLKVNHFINVSWWIVFMPLYIGFVVFVGLLALGAAAVGGTALLHLFTRRRR